MTQLADAFEQEVLCPGDKVSLVVEPGSKEGTAVVRLKIEKTSSQSSLEPNAAELLEF